MAQRITPIDNISRKHSSLFVILQHDFTFLRYQCVQYLPVINNIIVLIKVNLEEVLDKFSEEDLDALSTSFTTKLRTRLFMNYEYFYELFSQTF